MIILYIWNQYASDPLKALFIITGVVIGILSAISIHEFAHAWMANRLGDDTAKRLGRLSLNPLSHIDPLGLFLFVVAGFGFSKPVPYNGAALKHDTDEIKIALAGPASNLLVALVLALPYRFTTMFGVDITQTPTFMFIDAIVYMHIVLAVFNLIPIPPLDGSKVINYFLDFEAREMWERIGPMVLLFLVMSNILTGNSGLNILGRIMTPLIQVASLIVRGTPQLF